MWVFNEGVPRSGKSYDCIANHVLPAIRKSRHVWARINGLESAECKQAIADHLGMPLSHVETYLHHVETQDVTKTFRADQEVGTGRWTIKDEFKNALVVIDEVHEFFVDSRAPMEPAHEQFFALFGQNGGDGVIMTQMFKRTHEAIRGRVERKHSFQKLTAFGMDGKCRVTFHHSIAAGKFQRVDSKIFSYDPKIFPLYHGYAPGATNTEVYKEGSGSLWRVVILAGVPALLIFCLCAWYVIGFFRGGMGIVPDDDPALQSVQASPSVIGQTFKPGEVVTTERASHEPAQPVDPLAGLQPAQRYVAGLESKGRVRVAALAYVGDTARAWLEWVDTSNNVVEQLDTNQLREMGWVVDVRNFGVVITAGETVIVATQWPRQPAVREHEARTYNTREAGLVGGAVVRGSAQSADYGAPPVSTALAIGYAQGERGDIFPRSPGYDTNKAGLPTL